MNFDDLKDAWAKEPIEERSIPAPLTGKTTSAITRLRKNMRNEFFWTLFGLAATLVFMITWGNGHLSNLTLCAAFFLFMQAGYYFTRFFLFYKRTARYDMGLRKGLRKFVYELELNVEVYKAYSFCVAPVACLLWIGILDNDSTTAVVRRYFSTNMPTPGWSLAQMLVILLLMQFVGLFFVNIHLRTQYGRYLKDLKRVLEDLED